MLGKLIKNEFKATGRLILPLYIVLLVVTIINKIVIEIQDSSTVAITENKVFIAFAAILVLTYFLSLMAVGALTIIFLIKRFYDNMLKDEGYLSFTLPVTTGQHLISKIVVSYTWVLTTILSLIASVLILMSGKGIVDEAKSFWTGLIEVIQDGNQLTAAIVVLSVILSIYNIIITPYLCFSVGQRFNGHKIIGAFITYVVVYIINQVIGVVSLTAFFALGSNIDQLTDGEIFRWTMYYELILLVVESAVFTFITYHMLDKKLNLD
ncbi:MAG: hypothetical protein K6G64_05740 [Eubacterium sp.]|nr:hypothetical protein [Eubacterium sp.]